MRVNVSIDNRGSFVANVSPQLNLRQLKRLCQNQSGIAPDDMIIVHKGKCLRDDARPLRTLGVRTGDRIIVENLAGSSSFSLPTAHPRSYHVVQAKGFPASMPGQWQDPGQVRDLLLSSPDQLALLKQNNPRLSEALNTGKLETFARVLKEQLQERERRKKQRIRLMNSYPYDVQAQRLIAEEIRQRNVEANMEAAMEYNPETFGSVVMLYINCKVNGYPVKAFVDSGAQTTIMSSRCADRCNIMRLIDTRWAGVAKGVGVQQIIGRIHMVQVSIERDFLTTSLSILEEQPMDMLLGLDMLRRHECCIDLRRGVLRIGTTGTETRFLAERDLPACARLSAGSDDEDSCD